MTTILRSQNTMSTPAPDTMIKDWDEHACEWARSIREGQDVEADNITLPMMYSMLSSPLAGKAVLDLGCGEGRCSQALWSRGASITGCEASENMLNIARLAYPKIPFFLQGIDKPLQLPSNACDAVFCHMVLHGTPHWEDLIAEVNRILVEGGDFVFSLLHPCFRLPRRDWVYTEPAPGLRAKHALAIGDYYSEAHWTDNWAWKVGENLGHFVSHRYHRTLSTYINGLIKAGFSVEQIEEPCASDALIKQYPHLYDTRIVPFVLIMKVRKT